MTGIGSAPAGASYDAGQGPGSFQDDGSDPGFGRCQELLDAGHDHLEGDAVLAALRHDHIGPALGRLDELEQSGWRIRYLEYADARPSRLTLTFPGLELRLAISEWK